MAIKTVIDENGIRSERADRTSFEVNQSVVVNGTVAYGGGHRVETIQATTSSNAGTVVIMTIVMPASSTLDIAADVHAYFNHMGNSMIARNYKCFYRNGSSAVANMSTEDDTSTKGAGIGVNWSTDLTSSAGNVILTMTTTQTNTRISATAEYSLVRW